MDNDSLDHGLPNNPYNKHAWIAGNPEIGDGVWIGAFCLIDALYAPLKIGKGCDISSGAQILTHSTVKRCITEREFNGIESAPVEIGEHCFIGTNAVVLMGAKIGHHSVVGAGAVVAEGAVIPPFSVVGGVPAKVIGSSKKFLKDLKKISISIVIPAFNEEETIKKVVLEAKAALSKITQDFEIVIVDDGSIDNTGKIIDRLGKENRKIKPIHHKKNKGFTGAMKTSLFSATKNLVFLAPGDGQFDFKHLKSFVEKIRDHDIAIGYRTAKEYSPIRNLNSLSFHLLCRFLFKIKFKEISTVSMWRRSILQGITIESDDRSAMFLPEIIYKSLQKKAKFVEVPITWRLRQGGIAKGANIKVILKTLSQMFKLWLIS